MSRHKKYDQEYKDMILELYKSGMTVSEISREYEISEKRVQRFMREMNLYSITVKK